MTILEGTVNYSPASQENQIYLADNPTMGPFKYKSGFSLKFIEEGTIKYRVNDKICKVGAGQVLLVAPGSVIETTTPSRIKGLMLFSKHELFEQYFSPEHFPTYKGFLNAAYDHDEMQHLSETIQDFKLSQYAEPMSFINKCLAALHLDLQQRLANTHSIKKKKISTRNLILTQTKTVKEILDRKPVHEKFNLDKLAQEAMLSKFHLVRCFKQVYGTSPNQYFIKKKINAAVELIKKGKSNLHYIANESGFSDVYVFHKQFKKTIGYSPREIKENIFQ